LFSGRATYVTAGLTGASSSAGIVNSIHAEHVPRCTFPSIYHLSPLHGLSIEAGSWVGRFASRSVLQMVAQLPLNLEVMVIGDKNLAVVCKLAWLCWFHHLYTAGIQRLTSVLGLSCHACRTARRFHIGVSCGSGFHAAKPHLHPIPIHMFALTLSWRRPSTEIRVTRLPRGFTGEKPATEPAVFELCHHQGDPSKIESLRCCGPTQFKFTRGRALLITFPATCRRHHDLMNQDAAKSRHHDLIWIEFNNFGRKPCNMGCHAGFV
jgi:hypothetical protein